MKDILMKIVILILMVMLPFQAQGYVHPNQAGHKGGDTTHAGSGTQVVTTTYFGNTGDLTEQGVMFAVDKDGQNASSFHGFKGYPTDASFPWYTTPMQASDGSLYGVGFIGGSNNLGATYKYDMATCSQEIIANNGLVPGSNQDSPGNYANINELSDGKIYRADTYGGKFGLGAIISMDKNGSNVQVIHDFTYSSTQEVDINNSQFVQAVRNHLTAQGLYINPNVSYDGGYPYGFVVEGSDGKIYGTTLMGGYFTGGTVYSMNKDGSDYKILYMGDGYIRANYYKDGTGTTIASAISSYYMWGNVAEGSDGNIYFSGYVGGVNNLGAVSRIHKDGTNYQILHSASLSEGSTPYRGPLIVDNKLYQTYFTGGNGQGTVASMNYDGSGYTNLYNFPADGSEGGQPRGGLAYDGEYLYGTTIIYGGVNTVGTLYKVKPNDGSTFKTIHRFSNVAGASCGGKAGLFNWFPSSERVTFANVNFNCSQTCIEDANYSLCGNGYIDTNITASINPNAIAIGNIVDKVNNIWGTGDTHLVQENGQWYVFDTGAGLLHLNKLDPATGNTISVGNIIDQVNNFWGDEFEVFNYNNQWYVLDIGAGLAHLNKIDLATGNTIAVGNLVDQVNNVWGANDVKVFQDNGQVYVMDLGAGLLHLNKLDPATGITTAVGALTDKIDNVWGYKFEVFHYNNEWYVFDVSGGATGAQLHKFDPATGTTTAVGQLTDLENNYWGIDDINIVESNGKWFILDAQAGLLHVNEFNPATATTIASANMIDGVNNIWGVEFDTFVDNNKLYIFDVGAGLGHLNILELNGDRSTITNETCDDGNIIDGDGCSSTCQIEVVCGNGILETGEACDDNNTVDGDGCSATCLIENGNGSCTEDNQCVGGNCNSTTNKCEALCGNGLLETGEACDDNNTNNGDGCSATCLIENGNGSCNTNADCASNNCNTMTHQCEALCGNGLVESGETCDDNNTVNGDGCSATCQFEAVCGNGLVEAGEGCDDNNTVNGDGCSATCLIENGNGSCTEDNQCVGGNCNTTTNKCEALCGNGLLETGEACDDNNTNNGDGCSATCLIENGNGTCNTNADCASNNCNTTTHQCEALCGNGLVEAGEACDDSNIVNGDGCSATCLIENGSGDCTVNTQCASHNCNASTQECNPLPSCPNGVVRTIDFAQIDGLKATPDNNVTQTINITNFGDVSIDLNASIGSVTAYAIGGSFATRTPNGDESGIVFDLSNADLTSQKNTITIHFPKPVTNVAFAYTDIDGGNGISDEKTTFTASNAGTTVPLLSSYITLEADGPLPEQQGNALVGVAGTGNANVLRVLYTAPIDTLVIDMSLSSDDFNGGTVQRMFDITLCDIPAPAVCGNGIIETGETCDDNNTVSGDGCSDVCQVENNATIPDYSIAVYLNKTTIIDLPTPVFMLVTISELNHASNSGDLIFSITKNVNLTINFDENMMSLGGFMLKNDEWEKINETVTSYQFRYKANNGIYPNFTRMRIGLTGIYTPSSLTRGKFILNARIKGQNGETNRDNNKDSETLIFSNLPDGN